MKKHKDDFVQDDYFLDVFETNESFQTNNREIAFQKFYECQNGCILYHKGRIIADKEFVEDEIEDSAIGLSAELVGENYVNLNS